MRYFMAYIRKIRFTLAGAAVCGSLFLLLLYLCGAQMEMIAYPLLVSSVAAAGFLVYGYLKMCRKQKILEDCLKSDPPFESGLPEAEHLEEEDYQMLLKKADAWIRKEREENRRTRTDMQDYYARWVHQIKAPIAVMSVLLQQEDTPANRELGAELFRVEQYVDMALCYTRLGENASDLVIREEDLDGIIRKCIRKYAGQFIRKRIRLIYEGTQERVVTDEKWLSFLIEQLLSNAVKYTHEGSVTIRVEEGKRLVVEDTGIGIAPEDLPRIFEKGYTGYNGRLDKKSTGIGLYLCRTAAEKFGYQLTAESELGEGSRFTLCLDTYPISE